MTHAVLALDIGTSSLRTAVFDESATEFDGTESRRAYQLITDADGRAELDPALMLEAAIVCIRETLQAFDNIHPQRPITAVGASSLWHSLLGLDENGEPLTNVITWADARGTDHVTRLRAELDPREVHQRTGCMLHASFWPGKLLQLRAEDPGFSRVVRWVSPAEYLYQKIAGVGACAPGMASATGLYNPTTLTWDPAMLEVCRVNADQMQTLDAGPQKPDVARLAVHGFERLAAARWYAAIGDGAASNLGSGGDRHGVAAINLGTSGAVRLLEVGTEVDVPYGLFGYRIDESRYLVGGAISNLASLLQWCWRELDIPESIDELDNLLESRPAPDHGLVVLPFWLNERAPRWRDDLAGTIFGITQATTSLDIAQAILESAFHRLALIISALKDTRAIERIVVSGGLATRPSAMQRLSNVLNESIDVCSVTDASIRGAAAYVLSRENIQISSPEVAYRLKPDAELSGRFSQHRLHQLELERKLFGIETE